MIKILIADDHQIVLEGLESLLENETGIEIVDKVFDGEQVMKVLAIASVDIAVLVIEMPRLNGIETTKLIAEKFPDVSVLILTMHKETELILGLLDAGASGFVLKNRGKEELIDAIHCIANGEKYFGDTVTEALIDNRNKEKSKKTNKFILTRREKEVLHWIVNGSTTPQIAEKLFIAPSTVETHRRNLIDKTGVANSKALISFALQNNLLDNS